MTIKRSMRPLWIGALVAAGVANRHDARRWGRFIRRAFTTRHTRPLADVLTEARVRASVSADPALRRDRSLEDITVADGVVTLISSSTPWPASSTQVLRLDRVKGINAVTCVQNIADGPHSSGPDATPNSSADHGRILS